MDDRLTEISAYIDAHRDEMLEDWKKVVNIESHSADLEGVKAVGKALLTMFTEAGLKCEFVDTGKNPTLTGIIGEDRPEAPILFTGHMDTVFKKGTFGDDPFRIRDGKAYGPGCLDMKGGIIMSLYIIKALNSIGFDEAPIKIVWSGDEENAHCESSGADVFFNEVKGGQMAFNMETGSIKNALVIARKGCIRCNVEITGVEAHAGNDFFAGRSAILEAANKCVAFAALCDKEKETTVNLGTINGGTMPNCVPGHCKVVLDCRFWTMAEKERLAREIRAIADHCYVEGTTATTEFLSFMPPFEEKEGTDRFYALCEKVAGEMGLPCSAVKLGGSSDASWAAMNDVPVICSFGVQGEWNHTTREYAVVDSMTERSKYIAAIILQREELRQK